MRLTYTALAAGLFIFAHTASHSQNINKCIVNGKTLYSDQACPRNSVRTPVELHHAQGIVSPDRNTITDTINRIEDENWVNAVPGRSITRTTTRNGHTTTRTLDNPLPTPTSLRPSKKALCDALSKRIDQLDSMARQPQSASGQDWIREQKAKARSEQFGLRCQ